MSRKVFAERVAELLHKLNLPLPADLQQESCTLSFQAQQDLHLINHDPDFLDIICHHGTLPEQADAQLLTALLAMNSFTQDEPAVMITLHPASGTVSLLARQYVHDLNLAKLTHTVEAVYRKSAQINELFTQITGSTN